VLKFKFFAVLALVLAAALAATAGAATPATPDATTPCLGTAPPAGGYKHVVWIIDENESQTGITSSSAPAMTALAKKCGRTTNLKATTHPSLPNYIALTSGSTQGVKDDNGPSSHKLNVPSIFSQLGGNSSSANWKSLQDGMQSNCAQSNGGTKYAVKHNPAAYYTNIRTACNAVDVPYKSSQTPDISKAFTLITPNLCNDMHDCSVKTGDTWLSVVVPKILNSSTYKNGDTAIVITFDEGEGSAQTIWTAVIAPSVVPGKTSSVAYTHYSTLRATQELLGLPLLGNARTAASWAHDFNLR